MSNAVHDVDIKDQGQDEERKLLPLSTYKVNSLPSTAYYVSSFLTPAESEHLLAQISKQPWTALTRRRLQPHPAPLTASGHLLTSKPLPAFLENPIIPRLLSLTERISDGDITASKRDANGENLEAKADDVGIFTASPHRRPNHVLINEYPPGTGISPHEDGSAYFPVVCTVSLGSHMVLEVTPKKKASKDETSGQDREQNGNSDVQSEHENAATDTRDGEGNDVKYRIYQEPLSLLITTDEMYTAHLHGIAPLIIDEGLSAETVANWELLSQETRDRIVADGDRAERRGVRISLTYRDVLKVKDAGRLFGGRRKV